MVTGDDLKAMQRALNISAGEFAELLFVNTGTYHRWAAAADKPVKVARTSYAAKMLRLMQVKRAWLNADAGMVWATAFNSWGPIGAAAAFIRHIARHNF